MINNKIKKNLFVVIVVLFTLTTFALMYSLKLYTNLIIKDNAIVLSQVLKTVFVIAYLVLLVVEYLKENTVKNIFSLRSLLLFSIVSLLVFSVFNKDIGIYATGFFVFCALIYFVGKREFFSINKVFYAVFLYAIFEMVGTINTPRGFHFPEMSYSFYILPLAYSLFNLEKLTMLRILKVFFRIILIYISLSLIYWFFHFIIFNIDFTAWITKKTAIDGLAVYDYIAKWGDYTHPSYISLVLLSALISGFYLYYKQAKNAEISLFELVVFIIGCILLEFVLESRIGVLEVFAIIFLSLIYYIKMKTSYFKLSLVAIFVSVIFLYALSEKHFSGMMGDNVRKADYTLAINYIKNHPLWGSGYHQQREALLIQDDIMKDLTRPVGAPPLTYTHNQFLGMMVQYGIPGLFMLLILLFFLFWYAFKSRSYLLQIFMFSYLIFMFIEEPLSVQEGITRFTIFLSFFVALSSAGKSRKSYNLRQWFSKG